jgi:hypothetical protein
MEEKMFPKTENEKLPKKIPLVEDFLFNDAMKYTINK